MEVLKKFVEECVDSTHYIELFKHFLEECLGSIQLRGIKAFWSIRTFLVKMFA